MPRHAVPKAAAWWPLSLADVSLSGLLITFCGMPRQQTPLPFYSQHNSGWCLVLCRSCNKYKDVSAYTWSLLPGGSCSSDTIYQLPEDSSYPRWCSSARRYSRLIPKASQSHNSKIECGRTCNTAASRWTGWCRHVQGGEDSGSLCTTVVQKQNQGGGK